MKGKFKALFAIAAAIVCCASFAGCLAGNGTPQKYTVQYTDDAGTHQIAVTDGELYFMESIPQRTGYDFLGLFDSEEGGKQYVSSKGEALSAYDEKKSIVLFPHWKAKQFDLILDFQGAEVTSSRSMTVEYGSTLPQLPLDLEFEHKVFCGWYTKENCGGKQIADKFGLLPVVSVVNGDNFDLSQENARINLYAGFTTATYSVTLNFGSGLSSETVKVPYGTSIKNIIYNTRNASGQAVLSWSRTQGDAENLFTGTIEQDAALYAVEWANAIEFDTDGGERLAPVVAREGAAITLPVPTKNLYKFLGWQDKNGNDSELTVMPSNNTTLKAVWQAKIVFDSNGGESINDISVKSGILITLPKAERDGYIFAGWYTTDNELYSLGATQKMPSSGILLKAGWYKEKTKIKVFLDKTETSNIIYFKTPALYSAYNINFNEEIPEMNWKEPTCVNINFYADFKHIKGEVNNRENEGLHGPDVYATKEWFYFYSQPQISDSYQIGSCWADHGNGSIVQSYTTAEFKVSLEITNGFVYTAVGADKDSEYYSYGWHYGSGWRMTNFWAEIHYPDKNSFYL